MDSFHIYAQLVERAPIKTSSELSCPQPLEPHPLVPLEAISRVCLYVDPTIRFFEFADTC